MVIQRGEGVNARAAITKAHRAGKTALAQTSAATAKRKLSFKEKHALETLPKDIEKLEAEIKTLNAALADGSLYAKDPAGFAAKSKALAAAEAKRAAAEEQWLELEMLREEIEG
jgi:ATP-binding cassette subfamily F protein uup